MFVTADTLSRSIDFDSPFTVPTSSTALTDHRKLANQGVDTSYLYTVEVQIETATGHYTGPSYWDDMIDSDLWSTFSDGYTGQHGYNGPVMHNSEQLSGRLALDILGTPGTYVVVAAEWSPHRDETPGEYSDDPAADDKLSCGNTEDECCCELDAEGWVVLRLNEAV